MACCSLQGVPLASCQKALKYWGRHPTHGIEATPAQQRQQFMQDQVCKQLHVLALRLGVMTILQADCRPHLACSAWVKMPARPAPML
jgi:hypothetical protein